MNILNLKKYLQTLFLIPSPPGDLSHQQLAGMLQSYFVSLGILNILGVISILFWFQEKVISSAVVFMITLVNFAFWYLIRVGYPLRKVTIGTCICIWLIITGLVFVTGGIQSPALIYYIPFTVAAGLFFGARGAFFLGLVNLLVTFGFYLVSSDGYVFPQIFQYPPLSRWITLLFAIATTILPLIITLQRLKNALILAEKEIAERKKAEDALRELNSQLELRVREQIARYEATSQELAELSYVISHDLRTPVRGVHGFSKLLLQSESNNLSPESKKLLTHITTSAEKMGLLVDGLIQVSRIARHQLSAKEIDLTALVKHSSQQFGKKIPSRNIQWRIAEGVSACADRYLIQIAIEQLLDNAVKFTAEREDAVIEFGIMAETAGQKTYFVRDNGSGFDPQQAGKLFRTFHRLHRDDEYPGIGLGMTLTKRIIHRHGGDIWAHGELNRGAVFYFTLADRLESLVQAK